MILKNYLVFLFLFSNVAFAMEESVVENLRKIEKEEKLEPESSNFGFCFLEKLPIEILVFIGDILLSTSENEIAAIKNHLNFAHVVLGHNKDFKTELRLGGVGRTKEERQVAYLDFFLKNFNVNPFFLAAKFRICVPKKARNSFGKLIAEKEFKKNQSILNQINKEDKEWPFLYKEIVLFNFVILNRDLIWAKFKHYTLPLFNYANIELIFKAGYDANALYSKNSKHVLSRSYACMGDKSNNKFIAKLLELGCDPNDLDTYGKPLLLAAMKRHNDELVKLLLEAGADPDSRNKKGFYSLYYVIIRNNKKLFQLLLDRKANPNLQDFRAGKTPLMVAIQLTNRSDAAKSSYNEIATKLLAVGADPNIKDYCGYDSLRHAIRRGNRYMVHVLLEHGANPNHLDVKNVSNLSYAHKLADDELGKEIFLMILGQKDIDKLLEKYPITSTNLLEREPNFFLASRNKTQIICGFIFCAIAFYIYKYCYSV